MQQNNPCYRCKHLERYYTKGVKSFNLTKIGWCCAKQENVSIHNTCDKFAIKPNRAKRKFPITYCLNDLLTELSMVRKIIEANKAEESEYENLQ